MGRMLEALRPTEPQAADSPRPATPEPAGDSAPQLDVEIPFIEVGPRKSMEASPSVLACTPPSLSARPAEAAAAPVQARESAAVAFHPLSPRKGARPSRLAADLVAYHAPEQPAAVQYRELLPALLTACGEAPGGFGRALLFTAAPGSGSSATVLLNVAITAARQGRRRVLVVDANPRQPALADRLGLPLVPGLREVLSGSVSLEQALQATEQANLLALTAGAAASSGTRFVAETLRSLLRQARQRFDLVLVDGPAWDGRSEVRGLGLACDAVCLVLSEREVETPEADALMQAIPEQGARLAGFIVAAS